MSNSDSFLILETEKAVKIGDKIVNATKPCPGSVAERRLADVTNLPRKARPIVQAEKVKPIQTTTKEYTEQLQKEKMALEKMLAQRNKIIEKSRIELEILRANMLKMQEQNKLLAFSNTQMLAELNSGKDRLRELQHELGCTNGVLKALRLELEEKAMTKPCENAEAEMQMKPIKFRAEGESSKEGGDYEIRGNTKRRLQSNSIGLTSSEQVHLDEKAETKRPFVRRLSARFKPAESKPAVDMNEIDDPKFSKTLSPDDPVLEDGSTFVNESVQNEDRECNSHLSSDSLEVERSFPRRPSRVAARKIQSYKEIPLNVKMRRGD